LIAHRRCASLRLASVLRQNQIERLIELTGSLDGAQRARLMEIAEMCPAHRTLHAEVQVLTRAA